MKKKDYINILICVFISIIVIFSVTKFSNTFGSDTDWINQHTIFPEYLRNIFYSTGKLIPDFSFNYGGGQNIFNISYYGLLSPVILPSYLFPNLSMMKYITIVGFLSIFSSIFLFYKWMQNNNYNSKINFISTLIFTLSQPLIFQFHRHIMFVNYMPFLILALISIDSYINKKRKSPLVISVFLIIMTSYYYSVGGLIVLGIYYLYKYFKTNSEIKFKTFIKDLIKFILLLFLSILLSSVLLLPTIYTILSGRTDSGNTINLIQLFIPYMKIHKIFCGTYAIGYTMIGFTALVYLIYTKKKENLIMAILSSIILFVPIFRFLLNGGLYLREKCFIPFLPLIGLFTTIFINDYNESKINKKFSIYLFIVGLIFYFFDMKQLCFIILLGIIIILFMELKNKNILFIFIIPIVFGMTLFENLNEDFISIDYYNNVFSEEHSDDINKILNKDSSIYRIADLVYPVKNVNKIYNTKQLTTSFYSSTYNKYYLNFVRNVFRINNPDFNYFFVSSSNNFLFNMFMNVKYIYSKYNIGGEYHKLYDNIYTSNNILPYAYHTSNLITSNEFNNLNYPNNIEALLNNAVVEKGNKTITNHIQEEELNYRVTNIDKNNILISKENDTFIINVLKDDKFTIELEEPINNKVLFINLEGINQNRCSNGNTYITINNINNLMTCSSWIYSNKNETFHYVLPGDSLKYLDIEIGKGIYTISNIKVYTLDYEYISNLNNNITKFNIQNMNYFSINGNINVENDGYFITSIPYDDNFIIKVNNHVVKNELVNTAFLGFELKKGNYNIEISYNTPLLKIGKILSLISFCILFILIILDIKFKKD